MPQTPERKRQYAKERLARTGGRIREKAAEWRDANRDYLRNKSARRRREKRAMCLAASARIRARAKGIPFLLSPDDVSALQRVIDVGICQLSGVALTLDGPRRATSPSLDRIIPSLGYVSGNVRVVCQALNAGMGDWGEAELKRIAEAWLCR
jgi:hypothetical protein